MKIEEVFKYLSDRNIECNDDILDKLVVYTNFLIEYNEHTNLTAITNVTDINLKHFLDSALLLTYYQIPNNSKLLDIGTGAGFPGVILKIFRPDLKVTLLESNNKKVTFLNELITKLNLTDIIVVNERAENYISTNRESFDVVTSRAVSNLNMLSELSIPFVKVGGYFLPMKGDVTEELNNSKKAIDILGGKLIKTINYELPVENSTRSIVIIEKIKPTATIYPRLYDKIKKKPL